MTKPEFALPIASVRDLLSDGIELWNSAGNAAGGIVLRGAFGSPTHERVVALGRLIGDLRAPAVGLDKTSHEFVHDVTPHSEGLRDWRGVLLRSSTFDDIPLHTDGYNAEQPPLRVLLQVAVPGAGGMTTIAPADKIAAALRPSSADLLGQSVYPVTAGMTRLLWREQSWLMRFNYYELEIHMHHRRNRELMNSGHIEALSELLEVLDYEESLSSNRIRLMRGDVLVLDNRRTLHGRLSLAPHDGERLLHRVWCY
jgi:alpha-ketoglutarate-dependent taurine dioxygenase